MVLNSRVPLLTFTDNCFRLFSFQNLKNQIMTTNLWVEQVSQMLNIDIN